MYNVVQTQMKVQYKISIFIKQEKEANKSTGIDIQHEKQEDNTKQGAAIFEAVDSPATSDKEVL